MAAFASLGLCSSTGVSCRAPMSMAMPTACATPATECRLCWAKTRSIEIVPGR